MSVIIKDMDMPIDCLGCRVILCDRESYLCNGRPKGCPLEELVHCKDCRYLEEYRKDAVPVGEVAVYRTMQGWRCMRFPTIYSFVEKEDFCSYGERKGGDDK